MKASKSYDIVGVGFGPCNLALAIAIEEYNTRQPDRKLRVLFLEAKNEFDWYPYMMLPDSQMQISFLKDLATFRNPRSRFTFVNYLFEHQRLADFVNLKTFYPTRVEFADYLKWAAKNISLRVQYGSKVEKIRHEIDGLEIIYQSKDTGEKKVRASNVVLALGGRPKLPNLVRASTRVFHSYHFLQSLDQVPDFKRGRIAVWGAGQSAAEIVTYLYETYPKIEVHVIFSGFGFCPSDSSPYNNRIFDAATIDKWFNAKEEVRAQFFKQNKHTNYSVVEEALIRKLFGLEYQELVLGKKRLFIESASKVLQCKETSEGVSLSLQRLFTEKQVQLEVDCLVCATGFQAPEWRKILEQVKQYRFKDRLPETTRNYQLKSSESGQGCPIYFNGGTEHLHGLSATLLSVTAARAEKILNSILKQLERSKARKSHG
ncbi:MAG: SidA/IucD/PvdA family monooxygenase [Neisseriaceae bacterium]